MVPPYFLLAITNNLHTTQCVVQRTIAALNETNANGSRSAVYVRCYNAYIHKTLFTMLDCMFETNQSLVVAFWLFEFTILCSLIHSNKTNFVISCRLKIAYIIDVISNVSSFTYTRGTEEFSFLPFDSKRKKIKTLLLNVSSVRLNNEYLFARKLVLVSG